MFGVGGYICVSVYVHVCLCVCIYVYVYMYICMCMGICMCVWAWLVPCSGVSDVDFDEVNAGWVLVIQMTRFLLTNDIFD